MLQGTDLLLVESMPGQYKKAFVFILPTVFGLTDFAILFVAYMCS